MLAGFLRRNTINFSQACLLQAQAERLLLGFGFEVDSHSVLELIRDSTCTSYDCEFVALVIKLKTQVATMDKNLLREFPAFAKSLISCN